MHSSTLDPVRTSTFADLGVPAALVDSLAARGITTPFPIQAATLHDTLAGRDVLGRGRTGSGKTLAFSLPLVTRLAAGGARRRPGRPRGLVLAPTRELANQIAAVLEPLARASGLRTTTVFGGVGQGRQVAALESGVDVVIACPGRLEDLMGQGHVRLDAVEITVLDEADHMADLGFLPGVRRILDATPRGTQRMLFSATLDNGVDVLVRRYLDAPVTHSVDSAESPVAEMTHHVLAVANAADKRDVVTELASGTGRRLLFTRTKHAAKKLARQLTTAGIPAVDLHGNLSQNARERNLAAFSGGGVRVLVATDIAARGIHVDDVELVVHVDPPTEHKAYLHRSGRTARAGAGGTVVTVVLDEQRGDVRTLMRKAGITPRQATAAPGAPAVAALVGDVAPRQTSAPTALVAPRTASATTGSPRRRPRRRR
ncbi:MAG: DEAD/DEAH box helicase [Actinomycetes bacterium]